jgi:hypothetical protein
MNKHEIFNVKKKKLIQIHFLDLVGSYFCKMSEKNSQPSQEKTKLRHQLEIHREKYYMCA